MKPQSATAPTEVIDSTVIRSLAARYYARMASPAAIALILAGLQHLVAADPNHIPSMGLAVALGIGAVNVIAAWFLFTPIRRGFAQRAGMAAPARQMARLPRLSASATFVSTAVVMGLPFIVDFVQCPACAPVGGRLTLFYQVLLMSTHALLMALFMYFVVDEYAAWLRLEAYRLRGWETAPRRGGVATKLVAAYLATAAAPFGLVFLDVLFADHLEAILTLSLRRAFLLDMMGAVAMTGVAVVFIRRSLLRPLEGLLAAMRGVDAGDLTVHAPVVYGDELGVLTGRFNDMVGRLREKEFLRETFGRYVPERVAGAILANRGNLEPQQRVATILFTDIEDFTQIAERLRPERLVGLLNEYFSLLVGVVERHGGLVTQLQGDALLVAFNVPLDDPAHAVNAVRAALEIERTINHRTFGEQVRFTTRVGINTGRVIAGPVGAEHRLIYTVHGDAVNLAARLEAHNKEHGTHILVSESTRRLAGGGFAFIALGEATLRGKSEPVPVWTVTHELGSHVDNALSP